MVNGKAVFAIGVLNIPHLSKRIMDDFSPILHRYNCLIMFIIGYTARFSYSASLMHIDRCKCELFKGVNLFLFVRNSKKTYNG
jgi:hypothetical protein